MSDLKWRNKQQAEVKEQEDKKIISTTPISNNYINFIQLEKSLTWINQSNLNIEMNVPLWNLIFNEEETFCQSRNLSSLEVLEEAKKHKNRIFLKIKPIDIFKFSGKKDFESINLIELSVPKCLIKLEYSNFFLFNRNLNLPEIVKTTSTNEEVQISSNIKIDSESLNLFPTVKEKSNKKVKNSKKQSQTTNKKTNFYNPESSSDEESSEKPTQTDDILNTPLIKIDEDDNESQWNTVSNSKPNNKKKKDKKKPAKNPEGISFIDIDLNQKIIPQDNQKIASDFHKQQEELLELEKAKQVDIVAELKAKKLSINNQAKDIKEEQIQEKSYNDDILEEFNSYSSRTKSKREENQGEWVSAKGKNKKNKK